MQNAKGFILDSGALEAPGGKSARAIPTPQELPNLFDRRTSNFSRLFFSHRPLVSEVVEALASFLIIPCIYQFLLFSDSARDCSPLELN